MRIEVAREFFQRAIRGEVSTAVEFLDENVSYHVPGSHQLAGHFSGPQAVAQHLGKLLQFTKRTVEVLKWEDWMVGVNHVAALIQLSVQHRTADQSLRAIYLVMLTDDSKIRRIEMFFDDQAAVERFFSAVIE
jgi:ketosteroid isomerase-like protein